jgi:hypothetical protein
VHGPCLTCAHSMLSMQVWTMKTSANCSGCLVASHLLRLGWPLCDTLTFLGTMFLGRSKSPAS